MAEAGVLLAQADVARHKESLFERDVEPGLFSELQHHDLLGRRAAIGVLVGGERAGLQTLVAGDAVFEVDDEFAFGQFGEVDLRTADRQAAPRTS